MTCLRTRRIKGLHAQLYTPCTLHYKENNSASSLSKVTVFISEGILCKGTPRSHEYRSIRRRTAPLTLCGESLDKCFRRQKKIKLKVK